MKKPVKKEYKLQWMSLNDGKVNLTNHVTTSNPKAVLFDFACRMLIMVNSLFGSLPCERIVENIKTGNTGREHYWIEYPNGEILSIMETITNETE